MSSHIQLSSPLKSEDIHIDTSVGESIEWLTWFLETHKLTTVSGERARLFAIVVVKALEKSIKDGVDES